MREWGLRKGEKLSNREQSKACSEPFVALDVCDVGLFAYIKMD